MEPLVINEKSKLLDCTVESYSVEDSMVRFNQMVKQALRAERYQLIFGPKSQAAQPEDLPILEKGEIAQFPLPLIVPSIMGGRVAFSSTGTMGSNVTVWRHPAEIRPYCHRLSRHLGKIIDFRLEPILNLLPLGAGAASGTIFHEVLSVSDATYSSLGTICSHERLAWAWRSIGARAALVQPGRFAESITLVRQANFFQTESSLSTIVYVGEAFGAAQRNSLRGTAIGPCTRVRGYYGTTETGAVGMQTCEESEKSGCFHLLGDCAYIWVGNPETKRPLPKGEWGIGVVTSFNRLLMPIINFWTGDRIRICEQACECGDPAPLFELHGRESRLVKLNGKWLDLEGLAQDALARHWSYQDHVHGTFQVRVTDGMSLALPAISLHLEVEDVTAPHLGQFAERWRAFLLANLSLASDDLHFYWSRPDFNLPVKFYGMCELEPAGKMHNSKLQTVVDLRGIASKVEE